MPILHGMITVPPLYFFSIADLEIVANVIVYFDVSRFSSFPTITTWQSSIIPKRYTDIKSKDLRRGRLFDLWMATDCYIKVTFAPSE